MTMVKSVSYDGGGCMYVRRDDAKQNTDGFSRRVRFRNKGENSRRRFDSALFLLIRRRRRPCKCQGRGIQYLRDGSRSRRRCGRLFTGIFPSCVMFSKETSSSTPLCESTYSRRPARTSDFEFLCGKISQCTCISKASLHAHISRERSAGSLRSRRDSNNPYLYSAEEESVPFFLSQQQQSGKKKKKKGDEA